jgi:hypothetical protein
MNAANVAQPIRMTRVVRIPARMKENARGNSSW